MSTLDTTHSELGGHDALRYGTRSIKTEVLPGHPLEGRLNQVMLVFFFDKIIIY